MKGIVFCALIVLLIHFSLQNCNNETVEGDKIFACTIGSDTSHGIEDAERETMGWSYCCLFITDSRSFCHGVTDDQYRNMKKFKKYVKEFNYSDIDEIKCGSSYLSYSLFVIVLFVLIF